MATTLHSRKRKAGTQLSHAQSDDDDALDHIVMAVDKTGNGTVGCAYYVAREEQLLCMEDMAKGGQEIIENLKLDLQPTVVIIPPRLDDRSASNENEILPYQTIFRPATEFVLESALKKLIGVQQSMPFLNSTRFMVPGDSVEEIDNPGLTSTTGDLLKLSSCLNLESKISIGCAGAVITHLQKRRAAEFLPGDEGMLQAYRISHLGSFTLKNTMLLNADTLASLQIIQPEVHPSLTKQGPGSYGAKESLSVFGMFYHFAKTIQGRARLRQFFLRPTMDIDIITTRQDFVTACVRSKHQAIAQSLSKSLGHIRNLRSVMTNLRKGVDGPKGNIKAGNWFAILEFCYHVVDIADGLLQLDDVRLHMCETAIDILDRHQIQDIGKMVHEIVDLEESIEHNRTVINRGINRNLDLVKDRYNSMEDLLCQVARDITTTMPLHINVPVNVVFLPQLGYHIAIAIDAQTRQAIYRHAEWEQRFIVGENVYMKNDRMREMDSDLGDLTAVICDTEIEISHDLAQKVLEHEEMLINASDFCGELDCLLALVHGAINYRLVRPKMVDENVINIKGGRHILQEMTVPSFIPNDAFVVGGDAEGPTMIMVTGPNYSGKSVYQKQIALICFMAQIGSFVPAESAILGVTDAILTRVNTRETVAKVQSAFMIDLQQISRALELCTNRSLLVIDEFGKGTDPCDGAGLASAVFQYLLSLGMDAPKVLANTHFHEIFEDHIFDQHRISFVNMEIFISETADCEITYLYNLRKGRSSLSFGIQCAELNGIPRAITERAKTLADVMNRGRNLVEACSALPLAEIDELEEAEGIARRFLAMDLNCLTGVEDLKNMLEEFTQT